MPRKFPNIFLSPARLISFSEHDNEKRKIYGIEIFAPGTYRGIQFTDADVQQIAENFKKLKELVGLDVPLKVDHTDEADAIIGWITDVYIQNGSLYADAEITEPVAYEKIVRGTWKKVSCEIYLDFTDEEGNSHGKALRAVAIVAHPQVKKIKGLEVARFFEKILNGKEVMIQVLKDAIVSAFGWLSERFKSLAEEAEKSDIIELSAVKHTVEYTLVEDAQWDADRAVGRIAQWASSDGSGEKDKIDWGKFREAFAWYDPENADNFGAYKLPHHDIVNGRFACVWRGVAAAMAALKGARGGVQIPEDEKRAVYNHLARHYEEFNREPPEFSELIEKGGDDETMTQELEMKLKALEEENAQLKARLEELEGELKKKMAEEKERRIWAVIHSAIEKGKLLPAEKERWAEYLLALDEDALEKAVQLLLERPSLDLFEEKSKSLSPEEEEAKMAEEIARRMASYIIPSTPISTEK
ncbi:hypothetical protein H5T87_05505 [bacterium]|nr:hypothetical protein [bacterium]